MKIEIIINTLPDKIKMQAEQELYREYMAECARICTENTAHLGGSYMSAKYHDILNPKPKPEPKTVDEIVAEIAQKTGIEVI